MVTTGKTGRRMIFSSLKKELRSMPTGESEVIKHPSQPDHRTKSEHLKDELTNLSILRYEKRFGKCTRAFEKAWKATLIQNNG